MGDWLQWADRSLRGAIPVTVTVMLVFAASLPWRLPAFVEVTPAFAVMAVFYWTIYRPERFPYAATFGIGVLQDLLAGTPLGMTAFALLIVQGIVASQRTFFRGKPFLVIWWGFSLVMPTVGLLSWIISSACLGRAGAAVAHRRAGLAHAAAIPGVRAVLPSSRRPRRRPARVTCGAKPDAPTSSRVARLSWAARRRC